MDNAIQKLTDGRSMNHKAPRSLVCHAEGVKVMADEGIALETNLLRPRPRVTAEELGLMPPNLTAAEAMPWARASRGAFYQMIKAGQIPSCRLGHAIRIPTRRYLMQLGVLEEDSTVSGQC